MDLKKIKKMVESSYKKLKSFVYYSNNLVHLKNKIIQFEKDKDFDSTLDNLAKAIFEKNQEYFTTLLRRIDYIPQIKKIHNDYEEEKGISSNKSYDGDIIVEKLNYFIDMPIQLFLLDVYWLLIVGKYYYDNDLLSKYTKANEFAYNLYSSTKGIAGINFDNLGLYKPYYKNYQKWKSGAINTAIRLYNIEKDSMIVSLDLTGYFYSILMDFSPFYDYAKSFDYDFSFETEIIEKIYQVYCKKIRKIRNNTSKDLFVPIGMASSGFIANIYLKDFDFIVHNMNNVKYYSRYVDDLLIVLPFIDNDLSSFEIIKKNFSNVFDFNQDFILLKCHNKTTIQREKVKIIKNYHNNSKALLESLKHGIPSPSESHLMPNIEQSDLDNFLLDVFNKKTDSLKIRDTNGLEVSKYKLLKFMSAYVTSKKNTIPSESNKKDKYEKLDINIFRQLSIFFDKNNLFSLWDKWEKIFEFTYLNEEKCLLTYELCKRIRTNISLLTLKCPELNAKSIDLVLLKIKKNLSNILNYALSAVFAIKPLKLPDVDKGTRNWLLRCQAMSPKIRYANMINHSLVGIPLANYLHHYSQTTKDLYNINIDDFIKFSSTTKPFDKRKIAYSPRFIHFGEFMLCMNLINIERLNNYEYISELQHVYNALTGRRETHYQIEPLKEINNDKYETYKITLLNTEIFPREVFVALGNVDLSKHKLIYKNKVNLNLKCKNIDNKITLFKMLNKCLWSDKHILLSIAIGDKKFEYKETEYKHVDFLVFPELYVPFEWLNDMMYFSRKTGIGIITGVKYVKAKNNKLINSVANIIPFEDKNKYKYCFVFMREKNDYAPDEKELIMCTGFNDPTTSKSYNYIFNWNNINFSSLICYELTDITARANLKSNIDIIFALEFNRDISYFSKIIESTSRDDGCFVVQVNSSNMGDTRIVGPYGENFKTIAAISGGEKDSIHIGKINIGEYKEYKIYEKTDAFLENIKAKYKKESESANKKYKKYKKSSARL